MLEQLPLVNDASAWRGADLEKNDSWIYALSARELDELASAALEDR